VLFVLRSSHQFPDPVPTIYLRGLEPDSIYRTTAEKGPVSGEALMNRGIEVSLDGELSSTMVEITEEQAGSSDGTVERALRMHREPFPPT
jgi:hypothetical protein